MPESPRTGGSGPAAAWRWWLGFFAVLAFALVMTVRAYREGLPAIFEIPNFDKLAHFGTAGLLAFFLDGALRQRNFAAMRVVVPVAAALILVPAGIEEYLQRYAVFRTPSVWDFAADVAGVAVLIPLSRRLAK